VIITEANVCLTCPLSVLIALAVINMNRLAVSYRHMFYSVFLNFISISLSDNQYGNLHWE